MSRWHLVARHAAQTEMLAWLGCTALDGERLPNAARAESRSGE